jgi:EF-P beta-lysylation protein EpmB
MQSLSWQEQLAQAIRDPNELLEYVGLVANSIGYSNTAMEQFPIRVPHVFANRIRHNDPNDPILRQVFPYIDEESEVSGFINDPLAESDVQPSHGLLQKYKSRVLSITTAACAIHCRYCFRRHFPYQESTASSQHWNAALEYIKNDNSINEVILSGGDPLTLSDRRLTEICTSLSQIDHIKRIRFHTRLPVVLPARITTTLLQQITNNHKSILFVIHTNHANELDDDVAKAISLLQRFGILVLNQSVLLKGVNDSVEALIMLSERLVENNVIPYYLHILDPVAGAAHYDVTIEKARELVKFMQANCSGYLVPKLVKEEIGGVSKTQINI